MPRALISDYEGLAKPVMSREDRKRTNHRDSQIATLSEIGFVLHREVLRWEAIAELGSILGDAAGAGTRGLLADPRIAAFANSAELLELLSPHTQQTPFPVRAIYFDKSPDSNWLVPWHQDLTIAVEEEIETDEFAPWSRKDGIPHVQPPVEILEQMLTLRIHLDPADDTNGALRLIPRSHRFGKLSAEQIQAMRQNDPEETCTADAGDVLLMRPLILHASKRSATNRRRRILHIEYSAFDLPFPLRWNRAA